MLGVPVHGVGCGAETFLLAEMGAGTHLGVLQRGSEGPWAWVGAAPVLLLPLCSAFPRAFPHALTREAETSVLTALCLWEGGRLQRGAGAPSSAMPPPASRFIMNT